jgi:hypothetical protein
MAGVEEVAAAAKRRISRWRASGLHLLISIGIAAAVLTLMLTLWYPATLFQADGGNELLFILVGVDVMIGPLITLAVFRQGKRGMKFDLAVIGILQITALVYGMHIVYLARPAFIVFVRDQFQIAAAVDLEPEELAKARYPEFRKVPLDGPKLAYAEWPSDPKERTELTMAGVGGRDLEQFPRLFVPYAERRKEVLAQAWTLERMREREKPSAKVVDEYLRSSGIKEADVRFVGLKARRAWVAVLIDAKTAEPVKMLVAEKI